MNYKHFYLPINSDHSSNADLSQFGNCFQSTQPLAILHKRVHIEEAVVYIISMFTHSQKQKITVVYYKTFDRKNEKEKERDLELSSPDELRETDIRPKICIVNVTMVTQKVLVKMVSKSYVVI